jgi:hypothetical protein
VGDSSKLGQTLSRVLHNAQRRSVLIGTKLDIDSCNTRSYKIKHKKMHAKVRNVYDVSQIRVLHAFSNCDVLDDHHIENNTVYVQNTYNIFTSSESSMFRCIRDLSKYVQISNRLSNKAIHLAVNLNRP